MLAKEAQNEEDEKKDFHAYRQKLWDKKEKRRLIDLKKELAKKPKRPRQLLVDVSDTFCRSINSSFGF